MNQNENNSLIKVGLTDDPSYTEAKSKLDADFIENKLETEFGLTLAKNPYYGVQYDESGTLFYFTSKEFGPKSPAFRFLYQYNPQTDFQNIFLKSVAMVEREDESE